MMNFLHILFGKHKYITMSAIILMLIAGIIAVLICFYSESSDSDNVDAPVSDSEQKTVIDESDDTLAGDSCILLVCNSDTIGEAMFVALLDFHILSERIIITPLDMNVSDGTRTYSDSYSYGGVNELVDSVEKVRNCKIDRYIIIDKDGISELTDILGKVRLYVSEDYTYESSDKSYSVNAGYNDLEAAMLYTYMKINCEKTDGNDRIADLLCTIVNTYLPGINVDDAQELFGELCNCINTDITIADYYTCSSDIEYLLTHNTKCVVYDKEE